MDTSVIILAGGRSRRLGYDKMMENVGGRSLLEQTIDTVGELGIETIVVASGERELAPLNSRWAIRVVTDVYPGKGPLVGIYTGLLESGSFCNLVVAADMPFLNKSLLRYMVELVVDFDAVVPRVGDNVEPLHSAITRACLPTIELMLAEGDLSVYRLFPRLNVRYVEADEIERFDPEGHSFFNINTEKDLRLARDISGGGNPDD